MTAKNIPLILLLAVAIAGCGTPSTDKVCEPGRQVECNCPGGSTSFQKCLPDGSRWNDCECECQAATCEELGKSCGSWDDGCGDEVDCGSCGIDEVCNVQTGNCECAFSSCGEHCCAEGQVCHVDQCCEPDCSQKCCGDDGCGGNCPNECTAGTECNGDTCECEVRENCADGIQNQDETDVDCGGAACDPCPDGSGCLVDGDCTSGDCDNGTCASDNLPPVSAISIAEVTKLDGTLLEDLCAPAPSDTIRFQARILDPEGGQIQPSDLRWEVAERPASGTNPIILSPGSFEASLNVDVWGDYVVCVAASDAQGNLGTYDPVQACDCATANASNDYSCPCMRFTAIPREDIRIELTWDILGPDLDLHLVAPDGEFCTPTTDCSHDPMDPYNPNWTRTACVDSGAIKTCRTPNCDAAAFGCEPGCEECYNDECHYQKCSGSDCYWDSRYPDWGVLCDEEDDPEILIDCSSFCREEMLHLNSPAQGMYTVMVNYYFPFNGTTNATVKIFFKDDVLPTAEYTNQMTEACDTWNVALITWNDPEDHPVIYLGDSHSSRCCD